MITRITSTQKKALKVIDKRLQKIIDNSSIGDNWSIINKIHSSKTISNNIVYVNFYFKECFNNLHELFNYGTSSKFSFNRILDCKKDLENILFNLRLGSLIQNKKVSTVKKLKI